MTGTPGGLLRLLAGVARGVLRDALHAPGTPAEHTAYQAAVLRRASALLAARAGQDPAAAVLLGVLQAWEVRPELRAGATAVLDLLGAVLREERTAAAGARLGIDRARPLAERYAERAAGTGEEPAVSAAAVEFKDLAEDLLRGTPGPVPLPALVLAARALSPLFTAEAAAPAVRVLLSELVLEGRAAEPAAGEFTAP